MGKSNWDRQSITDSLILNSVTHFDEPKPYLTFHRELLLSHHEAAILTGALANPAEFVALVPDFLAGWRRSDDRHGLLALANAIRAGGFLGNKAWRFGMVPGPFGITGVEEYHFEIRLVLDLSEILPSESVAASYITLSKPGYVDAEFVAAFTFLKSRLDDGTPLRARYPGAVEVLNEVVEPPPLESAN